MARTPARRTTDSVLLETGYKRVLRLLDELCETLVGIRKEADMHVSQANGHGERDDRREQ